MKTKYIMPTITVCNIEVESMICNSIEWGQIPEGLGKQDNNNDFAFDDSSEDEYEDDGPSWSHPTYLRPHFN